VVKRDGKDRQKVEPRENLRTAHCGGRSRAIQRALVRWYPTRKSLRNEIEGSRNLEQVLEQDLGSTPYPHDKLP